MRVAVFLFLVLTAGPALAAGCPTPDNLVFKVSAQTRRDVPGFTEGLEFHDGALWESTGDVVGESRINRIDPATGKVTALVNAHKSYFGEGLTFMHGRLYQMSWREHRVLVFDRSGRKTGEMRNPREGWGLTHDDARLIASDGSDRIWFLSPQDFNTLGSVRVMLGDQPVPNLNELEYVRGDLWANIFEDWHIVKISPTTGCVLALANLQGLYDGMSQADQHAIDSGPGFVLNGIAYDPVSGLFTLTGKDWPILFTGRFVTVD